MKIALNPREIPEVIISIKTSNAAGPTNLQSIQIQNPAPGLPASKPPDQNSFCGDLGHF